MNQLEKRTLKKKTRVRLTLWWSQTQKFRASDSFLWSRS